MRLKNTKKKACVFSHKEFSLSLIRSRRLRHPFCLIRSISSSLLSSPITQRASDSNESSISFSMKVMFKI